MDEEFIFQVTEEELTQFPDEKDRQNKEEGQQETQPENIQQREPPQQRTRLPILNNNKVKITSLLDLDLPRNVKCGRQNKRLKVKMRWRQSRRCKSRP